VAPWSGWFTQAGQEGALLDPGLVAVAVPLAQRLPGRQLLRAYSLAVIQFAHVAVEDRVLAWPQELHFQEWGSPESVDTWLG